MKNYVFLVFAILTTALCQICRAEIVSASRESFSSNPKTVYESFEGVTAGSNVGVNDVFPDVLYPGTNSAYVFANGISLVSPIPNLESNLSKFTSVVSVVNVSEINTWSFGIYGGFNTSNYPANGSCFLVERVSSSESALSYTLKLPYDVSSVGGYWFCAGKNPGTDKMVVQLYDSDYNLLATEYIFAASVSDGNWSNNFAAWSTGDSSALIRYLTISGYRDGIIETVDTGNVGVDMLMFSVPEPSSIALLIVGICATLFICLAKK